MRKIFLTQGLFTIVDDDKYEWLMQWKWCVSKNGNNYYCARAWINGKMVRMHRLLLNAKDNQQVDHRNHNALDNRIQNIRLCTHAQNRQNSKPLKNCSSKYKGVHLFKLTGKWEVQIHFGKLMNLGYFDSEIEAAKTYDKAARKYFGEFAYCNFK